MKNDDENTLTGFDPSIEKVREQTHRKIFSKVSHDLRTPLSLIIGSLEIYQRMKDKFTDEQKNTLIDLAVQEAYRLDHFINNILTMENLESNVVVPKMENFNLKDLIEECIKSPSLNIKSNDIKIVTTLQDVAISSDYMLITKALSLLIDNSIKYAGRGASVLMECASEGNKAIIKIHDNGPGIPKIYMENIFDKYKKLTANHQSNASVGLGLTICRKIMTLLGGTITAGSSNKYSGAMFTLALPMK